MPFSFVGTCLLLRDFARGNACAFPRRRDLPRRILLEEMTLWKRWMIDGYLICVQRVACSRKTSSAVLLALLESCPLEA